MTENIIAKINPTALLENIFLNGKLRPTRYLNNCKRATLLCQHYTKVKDSKVITSYNLAYDSDVRN